MKRPLPLLVVAYCGGLFLEHCYPLGSRLAWAASFAGCSAAVVLCLFRQRAGATVSLGLLFFALGAAALVPWREPALGHSHIAQFAGPERVQIEGVIAQAPEPSNRGLRLRLQTTHVHMPDESRTVSGSVRVTIRAPLQSWRYGDRVRLFCRLRPPRNFENPGRFDYVRHLAYQNVFVTASLRDDTSVTRVRTGEGSAFRLLIEGYREQTAAVIDRAVGWPAREIIKALLLGQQATIPEDIRDQFAILGLAHVLAISGLHIGIVALVSYWCLFGLMKLWPRLLLWTDAGKLALMLSLGPTAFYCFVAGLHTATLRALVMIMAYALAQLAERRQDLPSTLCLAALLILLWTPSALFDISFQLSFAAVASLVIIMPALQGLLRQPLPGCNNRMLAWAAAATASMLLTSGVATLGTAPLVAASFHRFAWLGLLTNVLIVPYVGLLLVPLGLVACLCVPVSAELARLLFVGAGALADELLILSDGWSRLAWADVRVAAPAWWETLLWYGLLAGLPWCVRTKRLRRWAGIAALYVLCEVLLVCAGTQGRGVLQVTYFDVGHGDAALIRFPAGSVMLIDGGGSRNEAFDTGKAVIAPALYHLGIRTVDYLVLTHPHQDHAGGLAYILGHFSVAELWMTQEALADVVGQGLARLAQREGTRLCILSAAARPRQVEGVRIAVLNPPDHAGASVLPGQRDVNNASLVMHMAFRRVGFLFAGDIEGESERALVRGKARLQATVLKVPHHGRAGSSMPAFVRAVSPEVAVISCRSFGREKVPAAAVLDVYRQARARVYRTDINGAVTVTTDGCSYEVVPRIMAAGGPPGAG